MPRNASWHGGGPEAEGPKRAPSEHAEISA